MTATATTTEAFDVIIIGAGVNGAGLFRDLCEQGLKVLIVDKGDYGSGTSAAPSRLIHGGLKYLETGEFRLVAQSTLERNLLLANAPHLVHPLPTMIPIHSWLKGIGPALRTLFGSTTAPRSRGAVLIKIGLWLYDFYGSRARQMPRHKLVGRARALADVPALTPRIKAVGTYYDAVVTGAERLILELVEDGLAAAPEARALNWTALVGRIGAALQFRDAEGRDTVATAPLVINAAGPWIDAVNARLGLETRLIGGTKGAHILLDHPELLAQLKGRMIYFEGDDGRILLVYPFLGKAMVGSTDIPATDPDAVFCTEDETRYFLQALRDLLPGLSFSAEQIVYTYAGIRPLPNSEGVAPGLISRDHSTPTEEATPDRPFAVISLVGGKWTTFRGFAEEVADAVLARLGRARRVSTRDLAIGGGRGLAKTAGERASWAATVAAETGALPARVARLAARYGTKARAVARAEGRDPEIVAGTEDTSRAEIGWIAANERVVHLEDIVLRRTALALTGQVTAEGLGEMAEAAGAALGWDAARIAAEIAACRDRLARFHGVSLG